MHLYQRMWETKWSSVFAGFFVSLMVGVFLMLIGYVIGLSPRTYLDPLFSPEPKPWALIYALVSVGIAVGLGAYVASLGSGLKRESHPFYDGVVFSGFVAAVVTFTGLATSFRFNFVLRGLGSQTGTWFIIGSAIVALVASVIGNSLGMRRKRTAFKGEVEKRPLRAA